jgi:hypothetical protein
MSSRPGLAGIISLMVLGCAPVVETTETRQEFETRKRHEAFVREKRMGEVGYQGPRSTPGMAKRGTLPHVSFIDSNGSGRVRHQSRVEKSRSDAAHRYTTTYEHGRL